jgi:deazaflavin-dependent oxidoreductase (nitroreductase family)
MKHQIVHTLQKYLLNPPIKLALAIGLPLPGYALLETKGRRIGKPRRTPLGDGRIGNQLWLVAEHGMKAGYVRNIERDPHVSTSCGLRGMCACSVAARQCRSGDSAGTAVGSGRETIRCAYSVFLSSGQLSRRVVQPHIRKNLRRTLNRSLPVKNLILPPLPQRDFLNGCSLARCTLGTRF